MFEPVNIRSIIALWDKSIELAAEIFRLTDDDFMIKSFNLERLMRDIALTMSSNVGEVKNKKFSDEVVYSLAVALGCISELEELLGSLDKVKVASESSIAKSLSEMRYSIVDIIPEILNKNNVTG